MGSPFSTGSRPGAIVAAPGPPLASDAARARAAGRIAGVWEIARGAAPACAVEWDACTLAGEPLDDLGAWEAALRAGRVGDIDGAFAAAWRAPDGALSLARDAVGERSLFYARAGDRVAFGSTLRAVLDAGLVGRRLNLPAVASYLAYAYVPGRETLAEGVFKLLPGEAVTFREGGGATRAAHWSLPPEPDEDARDEEALARMLRSRLEEAVLRRLPAGGPVGATLSGGLDSSLVVALARRLHAGPVVTWSVCFGRGYADELPYSSLVARHCGAAHRVVEVPPESVASHFDDAVGMLGDPIGDPLTLPNALLFREASREVGVVLNGEGGDPCFGGPKNLPMVLAELYGEEGDDEGPYARERRYLLAHQRCYEDLGEALAPDARAALGDRLEAGLAPHFADPRWRRFVTKLMALNVTFKGAHHILPKVDAVSAPFGVVARSPLFDRRVVEAAFAIPPQLKLRGSVEKYLLKRAVSDLLPAAILERPKSGMLVPVEAWFRGPLGGFARERLLDGGVLGGVIERPYLERLVAGRLGGVRPRVGIKTWQLLTLEAWLRTVLFAPPAARPGRGPAWAGRGRMVVD